MPKTRAPQADDYKVEITGLSFEQPDQLTAHPLNPKFHPRSQLKALDAAMREIGIVGALIQNDSTGYILDGNARLNQLLVSGVEKVPVLHISVDEERERKILLSYDGIGALAITDLDLFRKLREETTFQDGALADLAADIERQAVKLAEGLRDSGNAEPEARFDKRAELAKFYNAKYGKVWEIRDGFGNVHRLSCGNAAQDMLLLMGGAKAQCLWSDPPYGVDYTGKTKDALKLKHDTREELRALLMAVCAEVTPFCEEGAPFYLAHPAADVALIFGVAIQDAGWKIHQTLIWVKNSMVLGHSNYHYKHEPIYFGWLPSSKAEQRGRSQGHWYGNDSQVSVFEIERPSRSEMHPTMKPVKLIEAMLVNSTAPSDIVLDPFIGSGSTMLAALNTQRICYGMDIDPECCAVTLDRMHAAGCEISEVTV